MLFDPKFLDRKLVVKKIGNSYYLSLPSSLVSLFKIKDDVSEVGVIIYQLYKKGKCEQLYAGELKID